MSNWKVLSRKDLEKAPKKEEVNPYIIKEYDYKDNQKLLLVAKIEKEHNDFDGWHFFGFKSLKIDYSIYNGTDNYDKNIGIKVAKNRIRTRPFCTMESKFNGEFDKDTSEAIMDVKAKYILNHWNKFFLAR